VLFQRKIRVGDIYLVPLGSGKFTIAKVLGLGTRQIGPLGGEVLLFEVYEVLLNEPAPLELNAAKVIGRYCSFLSFVEDGKWKLAKHDPSTAKQSPDSVHTLSADYGITLDDVRQHLGLGRLKYTDAESTLSKYCPACGEQFGQFARCTRCNTVRNEFIGLEHCISDIQGACDLSGSISDVKAPDGRYYYAPYFIDMVRGGKFPGLLSERPIIRPATPDESETVSAILQEAARWLEGTGKPMWRDSELLPSCIADDVNADLFFIAMLNTEPAGVIKFQLKDVLFWPDVPQGDSAFVHRLAVRRRFAGKGISTALLTWAAENARALGRRYLRLDCEASRQKLRAVYERFGFRHHSDRQVGPYFVSRYEYEVT
jgi:GNAT superfamily N-acetyltransferase